MDVCKIINFIKTNFQWRIELYLSLPKKKFKFRPKSSNLFILFSLINHDQENQPIRNSESRDVRFSEVVTDSFILKSFSSNQVFQELNLLIGDLKKEGAGVENAEKRMALIEKELQGLMKRSLMVDQKG